MRTALTAAAPPTAITGASTGLFGQSYADKGTLAAPVGRNAPDGVRELAMLTWGMPSPSQYVTGRADRSVTNIRNVNSPHWRRWLGVGNRCGCLSRALPSPILVGKLKIRHCPTPGSHSPKTSPSPSLQALDAEAWHALGA